MIKFNAKEKEYSKDIKIFETKSKVQMTSNQNISTHQLVLTIPAKANKYSTYQG